MSTGPGHEHLTLSFHTVVELPSSSHDQEDARELYEALLNPGTLRINSYALSFVPSGGSKDGFTDRLSRMSCTI